MKMKRRGKKKRPNLTYGSDHRNPTHAFSSRPLRPHAAATSAAEAAQDGDVRAPWVGEVNAPEIQVPLHGKWTGTGTQ